MTVSTVGPPPVARNPDYRTWASVAIRGGKPVLPSVPGVEESAGVTQDAAVLGEVDQHVAAQDIGTGLQGAPAVEPGPAIKRAS